MLQGEADLGVSRRKDEGNLKIDRRVRLVSSVDINQKNIERQWAQITIWQIPIRY